MASGDVVFSVGARDAGPASTATQGATSGSADPPVLEYDAASTELGEFLVPIPAGYAAGTSDFVIAWKADTGTSSNVRWDVQFKSLTDLTDDFDSFTFDGVQSVSDAADTGSARSFQQAAAITFTQAQADSIAAGEWAVVRILRDHDHADDAMSGDALFLGATMTEQ